MYENGKRVNGYQKKRLHKRKVKNTYAKTWYWGNGQYDWDIMVIEYKDEPRTRWGHPLDYWKDFSLTGPRSYAKEQTNSIIRREYKDYCRRALIDDIYDFTPNMSNGTYRKYFDYDWTVW